MLSLTRFMITFFIFLKLNSYGHLETSASISRHQRCHRHLHLKLFRNINVKCTTIFFLVLIYLVSELYSVSVTFPASTKLTSKASVVESF